MKIFITAIFVTAKSIKLRPSILYKSLLLQTLLINISNYKTKALTFKVLKMSSFNTPVASQPNHRRPSQPNHLRQFRPNTGPCEPKFRSLVDIYQATKPVNMPANCRPHLPNIPGPPLRPRQKYIQDLLNTTEVVVAPHIYYSELTCKICGSGDKDEEMLLCDDCDKGFHMMCLRPVVLQIPPENWYCDGCRSDLPESMYPVFYFMYICVRNCNYCIQIMSFQNLISN